MLHPAGRRHTDDQPGARIASQQGASAPSWMRRSSRGVAAHPRRNPPSPRRALQCGSQNAEKFGRVVQGAAEDSGGGVTDPPHTVWDCPDCEDNFVLDAVTDVGALMLISVDADLISMSPRCGDPILTPTQFTGRVDGTRPHRKPVARRTEPVAHRSTRRPCLSRDHRASRHVGVIGVG
jgi:hypothetical protein